MTLPSGTPLGEAGGAEKPAAVQDFLIRGREFAPATVTVQANTIGLWVNNSQEEHIVAGPGWELGPIGPGQAWAHTFRDSEVGTVAFRCKIHPEMTGQVTVILGTR